MMICQHGSLEKDCWYCNQFEKVAYCDSIKEQPALQNAPFMTYKEENDKLRAELEFQKNAHAQAQKALIERGCELADCQAENLRLQEALSELVDLMDGVREGDYTPDSFTTQPANTALSTPPGDQSALREVIAREVFLQGKHHIKIRRNYK